MDGGRYEQRVWLSGYWMGWGEGASARLLALYVDAGQPACPLGAHCICRQGAGPDPSMHWN